MKQLIVLVATIVLGISLAGTVFGMGGNVQNIMGIVDDEIESTFLDEAGTGLKSGLTGSN